MREHNKRWLMTVMRSSGSQRKYVTNGSYAEDDRHKAKGRNPDDLPTHESMRKTARFMGGKIDCGPLVRFLRTQVGQEWNTVHSEIMARIPTRLLPYEHMIYWFVADQVDRVAGRYWNRRTQLFIWTGEAVDPQGWLSGAPRLDYREFLVDPETGLLRRVQKGTGLL